LVFGCEETSHGLNVESKYRPNVENERLEGCIMVNEIVHDIIDMRKLLKVEEIGIIIQTLMFS